MKQFKKLNIDQVRLILAFMIIAIHTYPLTCINEFTDYMLTRVILRISVPIYLMITGYYVLPKSLEDKSILKKYLKKILVIYFFSTVLYIPFYIRNSLNILTILKGILFTGIFYHLWYFPALILGLILTYLMLKYIPKKYQLPLCSLLYIIGLLGDNYYDIVTNLNVIPKVYKIVTNLTGYTRNFIFYVPLFLLLGYKVKEDKKEISKRNYLITILGTLMFMMTEGIIIKLFGSPVHTSMYIALPVLTYYLFKYLVEYHNQTKDKFSRSISSLIYITHPLIIVIITHISIYIPILNNSIIFYLVIGLITYIICFIILKTKEYFSNKISYLSF